MEELAQIAERPKNNMYNNTLDGVSAYIQQHVYATQAQTTDQQDDVVENHTQALYHTCINDTLTKYPAWSTDTSDIENVNKAGYRASRQDIVNAWQKDKPVKTRQ